MIQSGAVHVLHDGMNLGAKEFVAARTDERGVLMLSRFTGASRELTEALLVNPYDLDEASSAFAAALAMPESEQRERMRAMRAIVAEFNVYRWAGTMLADAARLRSRDRLSDRLADPLLLASPSRGLNASSSRRLLRHARIQQIRRTEVLAGLSARIQAAIGCNELLSFAIFLVCPEPYWPRRACSYWLRGRVCVLM